MNKFILLLSTLLLSSCFGNVSVKLAANDVKFKATALAYEKQMEKRYKVSGKLIIINNSGKDIFFSNKDLYLVIHAEGESRTYVDSIASHFIDSSYITIKNGKSLKQKVYWVLPPAKSFETERLTLEWRK